MTVGTARSRHRTPICEEREREREREGERVGKEGRGGAWKLRSAAGSGEEKGRDSPSMFYPTLLLRAMCVWCGVVSILRGPHTSGDAVRRSATTRSFNLQNKTTATQVSK